ncbi:MAG TPA: hypothetical protein VIH34_04105 [Candidatus Bathyarchaeia archaeon]
MEIGSVALSAVGTALAVGLAYYSLRTIALFRSSVAARAWVYISLSAVFFSFGLFTFLMEALASVGLFVWGGVLMTIGGFFLFLGLRKNFLFWASKDHFS